MRLNAPECLHALQGSGWVGKQAPLAQAKPAASVFDVVQDVVVGRIRRPLPRVRHSVGRSKSSAGEVADELDIGGLFSPP